MAVVWLKVFLSTNTITPEECVLICLTLSGPTILDNLKALAENKDYVDICELRLDLLSPEEVPKAVDFPSFVNIPVILTLRRVSDGGKCTMQEKARRNLLIETMQKGGYAYVDVEDDVKKSDVEEAAHSLGMKVIRSIHDFQGVPADIFSRVHSLASRGDMAKIAVTPHNIADIMTLFRINDELKNVPKIIIGMGEWGVCTRILYKKMGSMLTFGSNGKAVAPGMVSARDLKLLYRADKLNDNTGIYGVVGNPVMHSLSPQIHNPGFQRIHYNAVYVPFLADSIRSFLSLAEMLRMRGFSVTVPFKVDVLKYLGNITREVKLIGSCNTVVRVPNMWKGTNTDYYGFIHPIEKEIDEGRIKSALIIGAGGAAKAIIWALKMRNIKVTIVNRTKSKADELATLYGVASDKLENISLYEGKVDLVVQATKMGLHPYEDVNPAENFKFTGKEIAYDIVYKPKYTKFLLAAEKAGCTLKFGWDMLMEQGKLQFESFTGYHYPKEINLDF